MNDAVQVTTKGRTLDHIGFDVKNLEAFTKKLEAAGIKLDCPYTKNEQAGTALAFITVSGDGKHRAERAARHAVGNDGRKVVKMQDSLCDRARVPESRLDRARTAAFAPWILEREAAAAAEVDAVEE